jgi:hypothetical protein
VATAVIDWWKPDGPLSADDTEHVLAEYALSLAAGTYVTAPASSARRPPTQCRRRPSAGPVRAASNLRSVESWRCPSTIAPSAETRLALERRRCSVSSSHAQLWTKGDA